MVNFFKKIIKLLFTSFRTRTKRRINDALSSLPGMGGITLIDVGAAGDIEPRWKCIEAQLNYIGFEPDIRSRDLLLSKGNYCQDYKIFPNAIWDTEDSISLNCCRKPESSSVYNPNRRFADLFPDSSRFDIVKTEVISTKCLDSFSISCPDFIKLDIQGGELNALKGAISTLTRTFGIEVEISFLPIYENQPLFGDIAKFLSDQGFEFIDFVNLIRWERTEHNFFGQCLHGDALFLRTPEIFLQETKDREQIAAYLAILLLYRRFDFIGHVIKNLPLSDRFYYQQFVASIEPIRRAHIFSMKMSKILNSILSLFGFNCRTHLIY